MQGHHFQVTADTNNWAEVGEHFKASALEHQQRMAALAGPSADATADAKLDSTFHAEPEGAASAGGALSAAVPNVAGQLEGSDGMDLGLHQQLAAVAASATSGVVDATGHGLVHQSLSTNFAAFASLFERAVQSVDPSVRETGVMNRALSPPDARSFLRETGLKRPNRHSSLSLDALFLTFLSVSASAVRGLSRQSSLRVAPQVAVPYHAGRDALEERRRGSESITRHVRHSTWSEKFVADDATMLRLAPAEEGPGLVEASKQLSEVATSSQNFNPTPIPPQPSNPNPNPKTSP